MFFLDVLNLIKETNRLRKEINRLLSKGMSNIYLKVTIETFSKLRFSGLKKFVASCCNLKIRHLGAKLFVTFLLF